MVNNYSEEEIKNAVDRAIRKLMIKDADLLDINVNERSISHKLAEYLQQEFTSWHVDCEYNRKLKDVKRLGWRFNNVTDHDTNAETVFPDIILHHRQTNDNLLVIEMKKMGLNTRSDVKKLEAFTGSEYKYRFGLLLVVGSGRTTQKRWFVNGKELETASNQDM